MGTIFVRLLHHRAAGVSRTCSPAVYKEARVLLSLGLPWLLCIMLIPYFAFAQVHVFETTIRVLGGLLSAHVLLDRDRSLVPEYDGLFLRQAQDLADRMLPAFDTRTGLPGPFVHLQQVGST